MAVKTDLLFFQKLFLIKIGIKNNDFARKELNE